MPKSRGAAKPYHHGNLREALVAGAIEIIQEQDVAAVSLRKVARQLGVTNAAPYHHFKDKRALLSAVASDGFRQVAARGAAEIAKHEDPFDRLHALGMAYLSVAIENPAHYSVMFRADLHDSGDEQLDADSAQAFGMLVATIGEVRESLGVETDIMPATLTAWSLVHGYASLWTQGALAKKTGLEEWEPMATRVLAMLGELVRTELAKGE